MGKKAENRFNFIQENANFSNNLRYLILMLKKYILAIDQGTTSSRVVLYNTKFKPIDSQQERI